MSEYTFNASALGVGGVLVRDGKRIVVPSLASVALAPTGGEGSSRVDNFETDEISFTRAESRVAGYETGPRRYTTYSDIFITNLMVGRLTVAMLQATVTSTRHADDDETQFELHAMYRGVEVDGREVIPQLDVEICSRSDYTQLKRRILDRLKSNDDDPKSTSRMREALDRGEPIRSSVVANLTDAGTRELAPRPGNLLPVANFANVYFGELLVKPGRRRVNLLRFDFAPTAFSHGGITRPDGGQQDADGCDTTRDGRMMLMSLQSTGGGSLTVGSGDGNGAPVWPRE